MDDIIIYLIFLAFALLSRFLTKKKEQKPPSSGDTQQGRGSTERPKSFEDLLREFTEGSEPEQTSRREGQPDTTSEYPSYEDEPYEVENYEDQYSRDEEAQKVYENSVKQAKNLKTIDELVDYGSVKTKLDSKFETDSKQKKSTLADEIRNDLRDTDQVRKAVIYAEILQRKY